MKGNTTPLIRYGGNRLAIYPSRGESITRNTLPGVSVICASSRSRCIPNLLENYNKQIYPVKELIMVINHNSINSEEWAARTSAHRDIKIFQLDEQVSLGECLNFAVEQSQYEIIARFDDDDYYAPGYLSNAVNRLRTLKVEVLGKGCRYVYFMESRILALIAPYLENCPTESLGGATIMAKKSVFDKIKFPPLNLGEDTGFLHSCALAGITTYSADRYNYAVIRHNPLYDHTWQVDHDTLLNTAQFVAVTDDYKSVVTR